MKVAIPKEIYGGETRVAVIPSMISALAKNENKVMVQSGAGEKSSFADHQYKDAGAELVDDPRRLFGAADLIIKVQPPGLSDELGCHEADLLREGAALIGFLTPVANPDTIRKLAHRKITAFAMEFVPRITRAQSMDALSSMATIAGYKAVLIAANHIGKLFPLLMTAAGTIPPATVLVLGAGVAGLQAIATAKRLGAKVEAFDPRPAVKEQVQSVGATFVDMEMPEDAETKGGYAREMSEAFLKKEQEAIATRLAKVDVVITTAQVFGKRAPELITEEMLKTMRRGSVIVDLAAGQGGNCALTEAGKTVDRHGVTLVGAVNIPALVPTHASQMYSKNVTNLFRHIYPEKDASLDFGDEITKGACLTYDGEIVNEMVKGLVG